METAKCDARNGRDPHPSLLTGSGRLAALRRCRLLDTEPEEAFDRVTRLAARLLGAPVALVTLVEPNRQFFKSAVGLPAPLAATRETPLTHSFCQHVVTREAPLVVEDARAHPLVKDSVAATNVLAYLGVPLRAPTGEVLGSLCVYDHKPHVWSAEDERALEDLAAVLTDEIELRETARQREAEVQAHAAISALTEASFDAIADIFFVLDLEGHLLRWNGRMSTVTGYSDDALAGVHALALFPEEDRPAVADAMARVYAEGRASVEADLLTAEGRVPYDLNGTPLRDGDGQVIGLCGTARDLTERKEAEAALRESERFLRSTIDALSAHVAVLDERGTILAVNDAWRAFADANGGDPEAVGVGVDYLGACGEAEEQGSKMARGLRDVMAGRRTAYASEYPCHSPDEQRWFMLRVSRFAGEGVSRVVVAHENVTERKEAEAALLESEHTLREANVRFEGVAANIPGLVFQAHVTPAGAVTFPYVSNAGAEVLGKDLSLLLKTHPERLLDLVHRDDQGRLLYSATEAARTPERWLAPESWSWEGRVVLDDGDVRCVSIGARPVPDEAGCVLWNGVVLDVTDRHKAQQAAAATARRTQDILESISDAFFVVDRDWTFTYTNEHAELLWGRSAAEVLGRNVWEIFPELGDTEFGEAYRRAAETGEPVSVTSYYAPLEKHFAVRIYPFAEGLSVYFQDVSAEVKREAAVRESEARFRQMAEAMPQIVWTTTPNGYHDYFNERWYAFTGMPRPGEPGGEEEIPQGFNWKDYLHPDDYERTVARWNRSLASGQRYDVEYRFRRASDGAYRWFIARAEPVRDASGAIVRWFGTCTDVHDSREAEAALRESEERLRLVNRATRDAIWDWDLSMEETSTRAIAWSPAIRDEFGWVEAVEGTALAWWEERVHPEERARVATSLQRALDGGSSEWQEEYRFERADGTWADVLDRGYLVRNASGEPVRMVGSLLDLTARKEAERALILAKDLAEAARAEAEAAARTKMTLLNNMSHEIRTPLTSVIGFAGILAEEVPADLREFAQLIAEDGRRLMHTLNSVLDLAELEASSHQPYLVETDVRAVVSDAADLLRAQAKAKGLSLDVTLPDAPSLVQTDVGALGRVVMNLLSNAVKFTDAGTVSVAVREDGDGVEVTVVDTGVGIADAFLPRLFDEFCQESEGEDRRFEGSGLGLAITKRLVERLGGEIAVESAQGFGSTFTVRLPAAGPMRPQ